MKTVLPATLFLMILGLVAPNAQDRLGGKPDWFDVPLKKMTVDFGPSFQKPTDTSPAWQWNAYRRARNTLTCYWFPRIMVKEYDISEKGADWISFTRLDANASRECTKSHTSGEKVFAKGPSAQEDEWWGYFTGVKEDFVFLHAADGSDGGTRFVVYDSRTRLKVFDDAEYLRGWYEKKPPYGPFNRMRVSKIPGGPVTLKYLRVEQADCDLRTDKASCWDHVRMQMDVKSAKAPVCFSYAHIPVGELPSMIAHPVFVSLESPPVVKSIDGPVLCWGPD